MKKAEIIHKMILILYIVIFSLSFYVLSLGLHNIDVGHNMKWVENEFNTTIIDKGVYGNVFTSESAYSTGMQQVLIAFWVAVFSSFVLGYEILGSCKK